MKKFLLRLIVFILPILLLFIVIELYLRSSPNAFITKSKYLKENLPTINTLVLGTSHSQNGIDPKFFDYKTANLSYSSQDIASDAAIFFKYAPKMPQLKNVILEYDYHRMDISRESDFYTTPWYYIFYGVEVNPIPTNKKFSLYYSNPDFFNSIIVKRLKGQPEQVINKYGFVEKNYSDEFSKLNYDEDKIKKYYQKKGKNRHNENSEKVFNENMLIILKLISYCRKNNIRLIFVSSPLYKTYIEGEKPAKKLKVDNFMNNLQNHYNVEYHNFSENNEFKVNDFTNSDHLNAKGAQKYSLLLNSLVK